MQRRTAPPCISPAEIKSQLAELGGSLEDLVRLSGIHQPNVSAVLNGRQYFGAKRAARLQDALHLLAAEQQAKQAAEAAQAEKEGEAEAAPAETPVAQSDIRRL